MEGEGGALFACYDLFFLLDSQIACIFCSMMRLTAIRVVTCVTHGSFICSSRERSADCLLKDGIRPREAVLCLLSDWESMFGLGL